VKGSNIVLAGVASAAVVALVAAFALTPDSGSEAPLRTSAGTTSQHAPSSTGASTGSGSSSARASGSSSGSSSTGPSTGASKSASTGSAGSSSSGSTGSASSGSSADQAPLDERKQGSEQPTSARTVRAHRLPGLHPVKPLTVTGPVRTGSATGRLATGFPSGALPLPAGAQVMTSSTSSDEGRLRVDVVAQTALSDDSVLAFYSRHLEPKGLIGATVPAVPGSRARSFSDGRSSVTVTVQHHAERRTLIVTAVLRRAG
jgi:hypothetical protein